MTPGRITYRTERDTVVVAFDYDPVLVERIKGYVPATHRGWDPDRRCWWVHSIYWPGLRKQLERLPGITFVCADESRAARRPATAPTDLATLFAELFRRLPTPRMQRAVKTALLHAVHPDHDGDHETAVALNRALEEVRS